MLSKICVYVCVCVYRCPQSPEEGVGCLELKLQIVLSHLMWVVGTKPRSSERTASAFNYWAISLSQPPTLSFKSRLE